MGVLSTYATLEEKEKNFSCHRIDTKKQFDEFYEEIAKKEDSIWRGMSEARFKHYTSLQRFWIINELDRLGENLKTYLLHIHKYCLKWNQGIVDEFLRLDRGRRFESLISTWSILRHHNTPTPLLDWTYNPKVALFFGAIGDETSESSKEIDQYFSVYELDQNYPFLQDYYEMVKLPMEKDYIHYDDLIKNHSKGQQTLPIDLNEAIIDLALKMNSDGNIAFFRVEEKDDQNYDSQVLNTYNILSQDGLFVLNFDKEIPLEEAPEKILDYYKQYGRRTMMKTSEEIGEKIRNGVDAFNCFNIHKSLRKYALSKLANDAKPITTAFLFPNLYELGVEAYISFLKKPPSAMNYELGSPS